METCFDFGDGKLHGLRRERDTDDYAALPRSPPGPEQPGVAYVFCIDFGLSISRLRPNGAPDYEFGGQEFEISSGAPIESTYYFNFPNCTGRTFCYQGTQRGARPAHSHVARWCTLSGGGHPSSGSHGLGRGPPAAPGVQKSAIGTRRSFSGHPLLALCGLVVLRDEAGTDARSPDRAASVEPLGAKPPFCDVRPSDADPVGLGGST